MADFQVLGHISAIRYLPECILIFVDEVKSGYRKQDGTIVDDKILNWKCMFSGNANKRTYINKFFNKGMLVQVKGEIYPYAIENGKMVDGVSVFIQTINRASYPKSFVRMEQKMIKESMESSDERPNIESFNAPDF